MPHLLTSWLLEAVAPLVIREFAVLEGVTGVKEGLDAGLILVQVDGVDLRVVQQEVIVHVQLVEHPAQGVLAYGQDAGVKPCERKGQLSFPVREHMLLFPNPLPQRGQGAPYCVLPSSLHMRQRHVLKTGANFGEISSREKPTIPCDNASVI